ncbi:MAG: HupE/UreJ family protein [Salinisphaeraceae bacterium]|nr:HupE/UreJ family protein [Salinisphaeraceae bacterium]
MTLFIRQPGKATQFIAGLLLLLFASSGQAHPLAPALLELKQINGNEYQLVWRISAIQAGQAQRQPPQPVLPASCKPRGQASIENGTGAAITSRLTLVCATDDLAGEKLAATGLATSGINVVVRVLLQDGSRHQALLDARQNSFTIPNKATGSEVMGRYFVLGIEHLILGPDHLAFLLGLLFLVSGWRRLVFTLTAFTLGHSVTLSLAALNIVALPQAITELGIAISIVVLARELLSRNNSWIKRYPMWMAGGFGLLHGLGFAGALSHIGLPQTEVVSALLGFNLGIEAAQLMIVACLVVALQAFKAFGLPAQSLDSLRARVIPAYIMGALAMMWCMERAGFIHTLGQWTTT